MRRQFDVEEGKSICKYDGMVIVTPYILNGLVLFLIPLLWAFWLAGTDWNLMSLSWHWVGFQNFFSALQDINVQAAFINGIKYLVVIIPLIVVFALAIASLLHSLPSALKGFFSVAYFVPYLTSGVATSVFVRYFFSYSSPLNTWIRETFGVQISWFTEPEPAFWIIVAIIVWKVVGYYSLFLFAAMESVPKEIWEASALDGATGFRQFRKITFPMIFPSVQSVIMLSTGLVYGIFSEPYLLTGGGPQRATLSWHLLLYNTSFVSFKSGYGATIAIMLAICIFITLRIIASTTQKYVEGAGRE